MVDLEVRSVNNNYYIDRAGSCQGAFGTTEPALHLPTAEFLGVP